MAQRHCKSFGAGAALIALDRADEARWRLAEGVDVLEAEDDALAAFRFANRAMRLQRLRSVYALKRRRGEDVKLEDLESSEPASWRAFQLAFLLLGLHLRSTGAIVATDQGVESALRIQLAHRTCGQKQSKHVHPSLQG